MRPTHRIGVAAGVVALMLSAATVAAQPATVAETIAIHVRDYARLNARELDKAARLTDGVYTRVGLRLVWPHGSARLAPPDGLRHFDVVILDGELTDRESPEPNVLGKASRLTKRARVYYPRVLARASGTRSDPAHMLALVLAHEIGHLLLPDHGHSARGIMKPTWDQPVGTLPGFTRAQAELLRHMARDPDRQVAQ
jgi:hypothetical protein